MFYDMFYMNLMISHVFYMYQVPEWDDRMKTVKWVNAPSVKPDEKTGL